MTKMNVAVVQMNSTADSPEEIFSQVRARLDDLKAGTSLVILPELWTVSRYDETARRVVKKKVKLSGDKLETLLDHLGCRQADLPDFGFYPVPDKKGEYRTFETCSDLRDHESVPLQGDIHEFFKAEVLPHVPEAWINMDSVKIGYEISFNKYFYRHKPLRSMEAVAQDILDLENRAEGLIAEILGLDGVNHD